MCKEIDFLKQERNNICLAISETNEQMTRLFDDLKSSDYNFKKIGDREKSKLNKGINEIKKTADEIHTYVNGKIIYQKHTSVDVLDCICCNRKTF